MTLLEYSNPRILHSFQSQTLSFCHLWRYQNHNRKKTRQNGVMISKHVSRTFLFTMKLIKFSFDFVLVLFAIKFQWFLLIQANIHLLDWCRFFIGSISLFLSAISICFIVRFFEWDGKFNIKWKYFSMLFAEGFSFNRKRERERERERKYLPYSCYCVVICKIA